MASVQQVLQYMKELAPVELAEKWDNVGLLVDSGVPVSRVMTALDITAEVVQEAAEKECQLIVAHHPVIFSPLKSIGQGDVVFRLIQKGISAICMHTNLDAAEGGVNDVLCRLFGVKEAEPFGGLGRVGTVEDTTAAALAEQCREVLGAHVKLVDCGGTVRRLALVGGAGGSMLQEAIDAGADCLLTGEASHHAAIDARQAGIGLVVAGHYCTEVPVVREIAAKLKKQFPEVEVLCSESGTDPYIYL